MDSIYFERQEGRLCAQHCLNSLLQGHYFTAVDLAKIAQDLDEEEKKTMAESGSDTAEYKAFIKQPSANLDDSGYFSVQVISRCLGIWGLDMIPFGSSQDTAIMAQKQPEKFNAFICNYKDHWFCIRKINSIWYNLNSLLKGPTHLSETYLGLFLAQLQQEGYSIFIVTGDLPSCDAEMSLRIKSGVTAPPSSPNHLEFAKDYHNNINAVLGSLERIQDDEKDVELKRAIELSLASMSKNTTTNVTASCSSKTAMEINDTEMDDDQLLEAALKLSMECMEVCSSDRPSS